MWKPVHPSKGYLFLMFLAFYQTQLTVLAPASEEWVPWVMSRFTCGSSPHFLSNQWSHVSLSNLDNEVMPHHMGTLPDSGPQKRPLIWKHEQRTRIKLHLTSQHGAQLPEHTRLVSLEITQTLFYSQPAVPGGHKFSSGPMSYLAILWSCPTHPMTSLVALKTSV